MSVSFHSPIVPEQRLQRDELERGFVVFRCPASQGVWLPPSHYWSWRDRQDHAEADFEVDRNAQTIPATFTDGVLSDASTDSPAGKRCPEDGAFLIRHRVAHEVEFQIDRCGHCGGVWLDHQEWQALKALGFHDQLHLIFTSAWQAAIRERDRLAATDRRLLDQLGARDLRRTKAIRQWLDHHPQASTILAYLQDDRSA